jgi:hypothetical protein
VASAGANTNTSDTTDLYPGSSVVGTVTITNNNPYPIKVTRITNNGGNTPAQGACAVGTVNATSQAIAAGIAQNDVSRTIPIAAHSSGTYNVTYTMALTADNACQGLAFSLPLIVASSSSSF